MTTSQRLRAAAIIGAWVFASIAASAELPSFQAGLWSFSSTVSLKGANKPQVRTLRKCTDPTDDIKKKWGMLSAQSCKFSPVKQAGNRYSYSSVCEKNGVRLQSKSVITVESNGAYRVETESHTNSQAQNEVIVAKREGDCLKPNSHIPQPATQKSP